MTAETEEKTITYNDAHSRDQGLGGFKPQDDGQSLEIVRKPEPKMRPPSKEGAPYTPRARFTRAKAIRYKCLDCCAGSWKEVGLCENTDCSLWEFRFGKNPTEEMVEEARDVPVFGRDK